MKGMPGTFLLVFVFVLLLVLPSCNRQRLLYADFEEDRIGGVPETGLLGDPEGDRMVLSGSGNSAYGIEGRTFKDRTTKWLYLRKEGSAGTSARAIFKPKPASSENLAYTIQWTGLIKELPANSYPLHISVKKEGNYHPYMALIIKQERTPDGEPKKYGVYSAHEEDDAPPIGYLRAGIPHHITINVFTQLTEASSYKYQVLGLMGDNYYGEYYTDSEGPIDAPTVWFEFSHGTGKGFYTHYSIDKIMIIRSQKSLDEQWP